MTKFLTNIVLLFCLSLCDGQNSSFSGKIIYLGNSKAFVEKNKKNTSNTADKINQVLSKVKDVELVLTFTDKESHFGPQKEMQSDKENLLKSSLTSAISGGEFYFKLDDSLLINKKDVFGETFLIRLELFYNTNWKITGKTKEILGYSCIEAVKERVIKNSKGKFIFEVQAWFTPEIPVNFGPKDALGLPGLVLQFNDSHFTYLASNIELTKKKYNIIQFEDEIISEKKYIDLVNGIKKEFDFNRN